MIKAKIIKEIRSKQAYRDQFKLATSNGSTPLAAIKTNGKAKDIILPVGKIVLEDTKPGKDGYNDDTTKYNK